MSNIVTMSMSEEILRICLDIGQTWQIDNVNEFRQTWNVNNVIQLPKSGEKFRLVPDCKPVQQKKKKKG